jgi:imidazoleglycerol phosphate synthase glutamine amidotransferase subunit HisH
LGQTVKIFRAYRAIQCADRIVLKGVGNFNT